MIWLKAFHIVFMVTWFAGLFYLPRLFVYHAVVDDPVSDERFKVMERRLLGIMTIGALLTALLGVAMIVMAPGFLALPWMHAKLTLVVLLAAYHAWCWQLVRRFAAGENRRGHTWYRWFNEAPSALLIGIVVLAVVKPF